MPSADDNRSRRRLIALILACSAFLVPWIAYLASSLPDAYDTRQWKLAWVGFDVALLGCLTTAAWLGWRRRRAAVPVLVATAAVMCCDAWFDVMLGLNAPYWWVSILMAALVELPLAVFLLTRARLLLAVGPPRRYITEHDIREVYTHPVRQRLLREIATAAPTTPEALARTVGPSASDVDTHLRVLTTSGFVRPGGRSCRRADKQGWRTADQDLRIPDRRRLDSSTQAAFDAHLDAKIANELRLLTRMYDQRRHLDPWTKGSRGGVYLSMGELDSFLEDYVALLNWYGHKHDGVGPGVRAVAVRYLAFPVDETPPERVVPEADPM
jgi:Helix-turn-helix domain